MKVLKDYPYVPFGYELTERMTDTRKTMQLWDFVAFSSKMLPEMGPTVRFYGGTTATGISACAPSLEFDIWGNCEVVIGEWMNEDNCPNAFDLTFVGKVIKFVQGNLPVLWLVLLGKLSAEDAMDYFTGKEKWGVLLSAIKDVSDDVYLYLQNAANPFELHRQAFCAGLYKNLCEGESDETFCKKVCMLLRSLDTEVFEMDWWVHEWHLVKYHGSAPWVTIPEYCSIIGNEAFMGNKEIKHVQLHKDCFGIGYRAFSGCGNLEEINFPQNLAWIDEDAFSECTSLRITSLPPCSTVGWGAFRYCTSLKELHIPESVTEIEEDAFLGCENLRIWCKENSCAHKYAKDHGIPFEVYA